MLHWAALELFVQFRVVFFWVDFAANVKREREREEPGSLSLYLRRGQNRTPGRAASVWMDCRINLESCFLFGVVYLLITCKVAFGMAISTV